MNLQTKIIELDDALFALTIECCDEETIKKFNEKGFEGNGYTWCGIIESIARLEFGDKSSSLSYSPEADSTMVIYKDKETLKNLELKVTEALKNSDYMKKVIENSNPEYMD